MAIAMAPGAAPEDADSNNLRNSFEGLRLLTPGGPEPVTDLTTDVRALLDCSTKEKEYWSHVAAQGELPIAAGHEPSRLVDELNALADAYDQAADFETLQAIVAAELIGSPDLLHQLRLLTSASDKRLYLDLSYLFSRTPDAATPDRTLCGCSPSDLTRHNTGFFLGCLRGPQGEQSGKLIAAYLLDKGLQDILRVYSGLSGEGRQALIEHLVLPAQYQQNEAKRRGHGAEGAAARVLLELGLSIVPPDKFANPMGATDPNINPETVEIAPRQPGVTISCDIAVISDGRLKVWLQALVQSSDPGQFGVDKSNETVHIRARLDEHNGDADLDGRVEVWGIVDGVGYAENKAGTVNKMLAAFHEFVQVKSLYKLGLAAHRLGLAHISGIFFDPAFYSESAAAQMAARYVSDDTRVLDSIDEAPPEWRPIRAGYATLFVLS